MSCLRTCLLLLSKLYLFEVYHFKYILALKLNNRKHINKEKCMLFECFTRILDFDYFVYSNEVIRESCIENVSFSAPSN